MVNIRSTLQRIRAGLSIAQRRLARSLTFDRRERVLDGGVDEGGD